MIHMTLAQAADVIGLPKPQSAVAFNGLSIDTRTLQPGNLFIALQGSQVDGHDFLDEAQQKGAAAALVSRPIASHLPQLKANDTLKALGQLAACWRNQFTLPLVAITGSNGKTTLKNMVAAILVAACGNDSERVLATQGTLNNHIGLPLTLARLSAEHRYAAIEMGMNHFGEIDYLTHLAKPSVAVITNAAASHLEGVRDVAGVARAKAEIFSGLNEHGIGILNRDDAFFPFWREQIAQHDYLTFGFHPDADIHAVINEAAPHLVTFNTPNGNIDIHLPLLGKHNILNALAATAATLAINVNLEAIKTGLQMMTPAPGRLQVHSLANGVKIIDDTYNANPFSLQAAVDTLATFTGQKILVLGDMKELGNDAEALHHKAGERIRQAGIDYLFTYGELSEHAARGFGQGAYHFSEQEKLLTALKPFLYNQTTILIKGSRSMRMEKIVKGLVSAATEITPEPNVLCMKSS